MKEEPATSHRHQYALPGHLVVTCLVFAPALVRMARFGIDGEVYSYVLLIPVITAYLLFRRREASMPRRALSPIPAVMLLAAAAAVLALRYAMTAAGWALPPNDELALEMLAFVLCVWAAFVLWLGAGTAGRLAFPLCFLLFMLPMPSLVEAGVNAALQQGTRFLFTPMLRLTGTPFLQSGMVYTMPGLTVEIAEACSGIRSTLVLLILSLLAGNLFLGATWRRAVLVLAVYPVAALRNALRVLTITLATLRVNPDAIEGALHRQGGPPFFVLSLVPFFLILALLVRSERSKPSATSAEANVGTRTTEEEKHGDANA
jgi:exosortase C (VPDSG-CTERM-specific)